MKDSMLLLLCGHLAAALALMGCGSSQSSSTTGDGGAVATPVGADAGCGVIVSESKCDKTQRPIVFVHGTYSAGDNIMSMALLFGSNGYCSDRFAAIDYNSLNAALGGPLNPAVANNAAPTIDSAIDAVLAANPGFTQVDLMGHSQGGAQCYAYLQDPAHAAKVAHYVHLAGGAQAAPPGPPDAGGVPTLSISSMSDTVAGAKGVTGADKTVVFQTQDHQAVCTSTETFAAVWQYLHQGGDGGPDGQTPKYTTIQCGDPTITLSGVAETLGDNAVPSGGRLEVYEVGSDPRDSGAPVQVFTNASDGGPPTPVTWQAKRLQQYEFRGIDASGNLIGHQYYAPFRRDNYWLRFLVPSQNPLAQIVTNPITSLNDDAEVSFVLRAARGAFRKDLGDSLTINGYEALNGQNATSSTVSVDLFAFDTNKDGKTQGGIVRTLVPFFVTDTDVFVASSPPGFVELVYNGYSLRIPNWPSKTQGLTAVTFE
jgi:pimeloyl-ACP methyl ester carboxylesterase